MAQRDFTDSKGTHWLVWSTMPSPGSVLASDMQKGWLTFDSELERRRLVPVPRDWEDAPPERMELYCRAAQPVARTTPIRGMPQQNEEQESR
ncbi:MAG TPA: hypothetical protein VGJ18_09040 [Gemmatimonadaceae bacterium]|jgi:hypothetical protein